VSLRQHLLQAQKSLGRPPQGLAGPPFPDRLAYLWETFLHIHSGRSYGANGPNPLSWPDIKAWDDLMQAGLKEWEVRVIKALDLLWLRVMGEARNDN
jgi:hypothetical protein